MEITGAVVSAGVGFGVGFGVGAGVEPLPPPPPQAARMTDVRPIRMGCLNIFNRLIVAFNG